MDDTIVRIRTTRILEERSSGHKHGNGATPVRIQDNIQGCRLNVSSATIRNEMSDLTDMGYIVQPHTSAGRILLIKAIGFMWMN